VAVLLVTFAVLAHVFTVSISEGTSESPVIRNRFSEHSLELEVRVFAETLIVA
jgi:hypothetical protein